jgi:hypothetical protein
MVVGGLLDPLTALLDAGRLPRDLTNTVATLAMQAATMAGKPTRS